MFPCTKRLPVNVCVSVTLVPKSVLPETKFTLLVIVITCKSVT